MAKTAKITLGGKEITVHAFTIGELERVAEALEALEVGKAGNRVKAIFAVLRIALERAEPAVDPDTIEIDSLDEINAASAAILELAGMTPKKAPGDPFGEKMAPAP